MTAPGQLTREGTNRKATVGGLEVNYYEAGSGPVLLCTHGGGPGANAWDNTRHSLAELARDFRVILMDLPGFGGSQKHVSRGGVPMDVFLARLKRDFLDELGIQRASVYGSSAFSAAALRFGLAYPERTGKVIIQAYSPVPEGAPTPGLLSLQAFAKDPSLENMRRMCEMFVPDPRLCTPEFVQARFDAAMIPGHLESRREFPMSANSDLRDELPGLGAPVLVLWGARDNMIPVKGVLDGLALIPDVRAHVWGGTGHFVAYEHPAEFARLVAGFLRS
jgi:4,5:9,10-diseco-3-hydroxy-5,9,17-trioxoandrosta-1(10),2-diene-4-oate hydrolase